MTLFKWSQTAANNGTADLTCPFPEGMAPSAYNDGMRGAMAAVAKYRDDVAGAIVTTGSSNGYALSSYEGFDSLAHLNGQIIAFSPHVTNGAGPVTLTVDGIGRNLRSSPGVELLAGTLIAGTPYVAMFNQADNVFYLRGFYGNPYNIPLLGGIDYWGTTAPNSSFVFPTGQAVSRTIYSAAFSIIGTTYGAGDGSTTFNLPDKTGRVSAMKEASAARLTSAIGGVDGGTLGAAGASQSVTVLQANLPNVSLPVTGGTATPSVAGGGAPLAVGTGTGGSNVGTHGTDFGVYTIPGFSPLSVTLGGSPVAALGGSGAALANVQPTIICNYILRII